MGKGFLVLSSTSTSLDEGGMAAMLVGPDGRLVKSTPIVQRGRVPYSPAVAYGDGRYLVVYGTYNGTIKAVMLSSDGTQQGSAFDITGSGPVAVAHGGGVFLVAGHSSARPPVRRQADRRRWAPSLPPRPSPYRAPPRPLLVEGGGSEPWWPAGGGPAR
jgi:hypothetical protein